MCRHFKEERIFMDFFCKGFHEKCEHTEIALNIIQKQYFTSKNRLSFHYSRIATL